MRNVSTDDYTGYSSLLLNFAHIAVYCSYKKNNVNILFEHAISTAPFELTRIIIKVRSTSIYTDLSDSLSRLLVTCARRIRFHLYETYKIQRYPVSVKQSLIGDTDRYDRPDADEMRATSLFESFGINCLEGRRGRPFL